MTDDNKLAEHLAKLSALAEEVNRGECGAWREWAVNLLAWDIKKLNEFTDDELRSAIGARLS